MVGRLFLRITCLCAVGAAPLAFHAIECAGAAELLAADAALAAELDQVAALQLKTLEATKRARNDRLNELFRQQVQQADHVTAEEVSAFTALLKQHGLTTFEDFWSAEAAPLRYRKDPASGEDVPILGPLGSDVINPWLAAVKVIEGKPLDEQPVYRLATLVLREHIDFTLVGIRDPNLSLELLPPKLRENAAAAYAQLNPTNRFDGGFDHPLFYVTVREAAKKLFQQDYPHLRMTMAEVVQPESAGGFGVRSCLPCHENSHAGVYRRLLSQGMYLQSKAADAAADSPEAGECRAKAETLLRAAEIVRETAPEKIDPQAVRQSLAAMTPENLARLRPGYADFCSILREKGCLQCHTKGAEVPEEKDPSAYGAFTLEASEYFQTDNIRALLSVIKPHSPEESKLLMKAAAKVSHEGSDTVKLDESGAGQLRDRLEKWLRTLE